MDINKFIGEKIRNFRTKKGVNQEELAEYLGVTTQAVSRYELGDRKTDNDILFKLADYFNVSINDFFPPLNINNTVNANYLADNIKIPVYGAIKAGTPIEAQTDIVDYVDIPKEWTRGDKKYFGLRISGDSMAPKYLDNDLVIFESTQDYEIANGKDCAVMVDSSDVTFKNVSLNHAGITLIPLNLNNQDNYQPTFYDSEQIEKLPIRIIGIAREKRSKV